MVINVVITLTVCLVFPFAALMQMPFLDALSSQGPRSMPNSFLPASPVLRAGVLVLGDAFNMRHPLTGAGMSVALHDVEYWKHALRSVPDLHDTEELLRIQQSFHWQRKLSHSFVTNTLAQALYALFAAGDDGTYLALQSVCKCGNPLSSVSFLVVELELLRS